MPSVRRQNRPGGGLVIFTLLVLCALFMACVSDPKTVEAPQQQAPVEETPSGTEPAVVLSVPDEIRTLIESGSPSSLQASLVMLRGRELGNSAFGRMMNAIVIALLKTVYPGIIQQLPLPDPPQTHAYAGLMRDVERGVYTPSADDSQDYLELVLPFLALYNETNGEKLLQAVPNLRKAEQLNPKAVLAPLFLGIIYERAAQADEAEAEYTKAWILSGDLSSDANPDCYPAALGLARIIESRGQGREAVNYLSNLVIRFPDNLQVKRQLAYIYYRSKDWARAEPAIAEILQRDSRDGEFILMRAHVLIEQGQWTQAQVPLDAYASINPNNRLYLFLRARLQAEGYRNRDSALNYLRSIIRSPQNQSVNDEASEYAVRLLMESQRIEDQNEGRDLLRRLLSSPNPSLAVLSLGLQDCIRREAWAEARPYITRLLAERRSFQDLLDAYTVERNQGNNAAALSYARELYEADRSNDEGVYAYISALIDTGRQSEAATMIENRIANLPGGYQKSRYFYLRSRISRGDEAAMADLRASLFEDPRNLSALIAMFEIYHRRKDERRAVYYLRQALAISPNNPQLKRYETEYAGVIGGGP